MVNLVEKLFHAWERRLARKDDPERRVLPFGWGTEYLGDGIGSESQAREFVHRHVREALEASERYFQPPETGEFQLEGNDLYFEAPLRTPHHENNRAHGTLFPREGTGPAVVVLPQWNAKGSAQDGLCRLLNLYGMTALKLTLPYHGLRMPAGLVRADYILSPNLGRTLQACRQAVLEARTAVSWLIKRGYGPIGIVGTSLGSCVAFIAFAHDTNVRAGVFNHISPYFGDVVWRGLSTRHIRQGLETQIDLEELRTIWLPISPQSYVYRLAGQDRRSLLVFARYDLSFPPDLSRKLVQEFERQRVAHDVFTLPCGHYTTAKFPFNTMDGWGIARFLRATCVDDVRGQKR
jgi:hypothetical protein